jgi:ABC-type sulfate/molybdate transport systems ATPase subunit
MLILLDKPNVLILDEPDNDLDVDMLAVVESLLDTWPGTLLLITHDRHLMERVTDDQFAVINGKVRHLPGGIDEYLRILDARDGAGVGATLGLPTQEPRNSGSEAFKEVAGASSPSLSGPDQQTQPALSRAEEYSLKKELASTERKLETACRKADVVRSEAQETDPSDYEALLDVQARLSSAEMQVAELEDRWVELSEKLAP